MRRKIVILALLCLVVCASLLAYLTQLEQRDLARRLIRLHVVANSDSEMDQADKLAVRDAVLPLITELTAQCMNREAAEAALQKALPGIRERAEQTLQARGHDAPVEVRLQSEDFPRRVYDTFSLPAGQYETLRLTIGQGSGHNWWCVAFPSVCLPATTEDFVAAASAAGLSEEQTDFLTGRSETVTLKFRILDWLSELFS